MECSFVQKIPHKCWEEADRKKYLSCECNTDSLKKESLNSILAVKMGFKIPVYSCIIYFDFSHHPIPSLHLNIRKNMES